MHLPYRNNVLNSVFKNIRVYFRSKTLNSQNDVCDTILNTSCYTKLVRVLNCNSSNFEFPFFLIHQSFLFSPVINQFSRDITVFYLRSVANFSLGYLKYVYIFCVNTCVLRVYKIRVHKKECIEKLERIENDIEAVKHQIQSLTMFIFPRYL